MNASLGVIAVCLLSTPWRKSDSILRPFSNRVSLVISTLETESHSGARRRPSWFPLGKHRRTDLAPCFQEFISQNPAPEEENSIYFTLGCSAERESIYPIGGKPYASGPLPIEEIVPHCFPSRNRRRLRNFVHPQPGPVSFAAPGF